MGIDYTPSMNTHKDLSSFRFWCQKVLPAVYDDSLSYYELLNKMVVYLNDVITNNNMMGENVRNLYNAYVSLQNWVNHYFDNLDVQEEINDKLDTMASDGSLSKLIQPLFDVYKIEMDKHIAIQDKNISALKSRMDTFTSLGDGSTSGDAELIDIRVGYNGTTYPNAGGAVRDQVDQLVSRMVDVENNFYDFQEIENIGTSITSTQNFGFRFAEPVEYVEVNPTCEAVSGTYTWTRYKTADGSPLADHANLVEHSTGVVEIGKSVTFYNVGLDDFIAVTPSDGTLLYANSVTRINYPNAKLAYINPTDGDFHMSSLDVDEHVAMGGVFKLRISKPNTPVRQWEGKKWACVGDSLTESYVPSSKLYHDYVAEATGITTVNMGVSGTGWKAGEANNKSMYQRILNISADVDVVTIFGSGNDLGYTLGTPNDTGTDTICGCINTTIDNLYSVIPNVSLGIVTPTPWSPYNPANVDNKMSLLSDAIVQICKNRSIPCLDLYHCSNLRPWDSTFREVAYTKEPDSRFLIHPDETGHKLIAARFKNFLESLIL